MSEQGGNSSYAGPGPGHGQACLLRWISDAEYMRSLRSWCLDQFLASGQVVCFQHGYSAFDGTCSIIGLLSAHIGYSQGLRTFVAARSAPWVMWSCFAGGHWAILPGSSSRSLYTWSCEAVGHALVGWHRHIRTSSSSSCVPISPERRAGGSGLSMG